MRKISVKLMKKEKNTSANPVPNPLPSNAAVNSSDPGLCLCYLIIGICSNIKYFYVDILKVLVSSLSALHI